MFEYISLPRRTRVLLSVSLLAFGILVFVPWSVYFGNSQQFPFIFQDFVNWNLRILTLSIVGTSIILLLIPAFISDYLVAVIAGLGLCVYVQAMFMNLFLGTMNGAELKWKDHLFWGIINMIIWVVILFAPISLKRLVPSLFSRIVSVTTGIVLSLEIAAVIFMVISASQNVWSRQVSFYCDGSKQFMFSQNKNILVLIFDTLGSEFVKQTFERFPETKESVKDFIWYTDARSNYNKTFPGFHHELTGTYIQSANDIHDLYMQSWHSPSAQSFYSQINKAGYEARLYVTTSLTGTGPADCFHEYFSNIQIEDNHVLIDQEKLHCRLNQMSLFSSFPYLLKHYYSYPDDFFNDVVSLDNTQSNVDIIPRSNDEYFKKLEEDGVHVEKTDASLLSIHYTRGVHRPWVIDENCIRIKTVYEDPFATTRSCFCILSRLIKDLQKHNIYDNTAILILSDHGGNDPVFSTPFDMTFMVKHFNENKDDLTYDNSKISSIDILPTILNIACGDQANYESFEGYPSSNIPPERERLVYSLYNNNDYPVFRTDKTDWYSYEFNCLKEFLFKDVEHLSFRGFIPLKRDEGSK